MSQMIDKMRTDEHRKRLEDEASRAAKARQHRVTHDRKTVQAFAASRRAEQEKARARIRRDRERRRVRLATEAATMNKQLVESARNTDRQANNGKDAVQKAREMLERKIAHLAKQTSRELGPSTQEVKTRRRKRDA